MSVQNIIQLTRNFWRHDRLLLTCSLFDLNDKVQLRFDVGFLLVVLGLDGFFKDLVSVEHGEPLETRHEFVDHFADLVSVSCAS